MPQLRILEAAEKQLAKLDSKTAKRLIAKLQWLTLSLGKAKPVALKGPLAGLLKLRVGDYRIIYQVVDDGKTILVHFLGHRRDVYRRR